MSTRPSIKKRRQAAMAADAAESTPSSAQTRDDADATAPSPALTAREESTKRATKEAPRTSSTSDTTRVGVYIAASGYDDAKAAYLSDWQHGGQSDTFGKWISAALEAHAARGADERARLARHGGRAETRTGSSRSFTVPVDTVERMRAAIIEDQDAGRWPSDSAWCADAIAAAVDLARERGGGVLPQPPARLPNRLRR